MSYYNKVGITIMITIRKIEESTAKLYGPDDVLIGEITSELQLYDVRCQIKEQGLGGYYLIWKDPNSGQDFEMWFNKRGQINHWPKGFFHKIDNYLHKLVDWGDDLETEA